jgi:hypothetical protein
MSMTIRQVGPTHHVGQLVKGEQGWFGQAATAGLGAFFHGFGDGHGQRVVSGAAEPAPSLKRM